MARIGPSMFVMPSEKPSALSALSRTRNELDPRLANSPSLPGTLATEGRSAWHDDTVSSWNSAILV